MVEYSNLDIGIHTYIYYIFRSFTTAACCTRGSYKKNKKEERGNKYDE